MGKIFVSVMVLVAALVFGGLAVAQDQGSAPKKGPEKAKTEQPTKQNVTQKPPAANAQVGKDHLEMAKEKFAKGEFKAAAVELKAEAKIIYQQAKRVGADKTGLDEAAAKLDKLADSVEKGAVKSEQELDDAADSAYTALAKHYDQMAQKGWAKNKAQAAKDLRQSSNYLEKALKSAGKAISEDYDAAIKDARAAADKVQTKAKYTEDEVGNAISNLGSKIEEHAKPADAPK